MSSERRFFWLGVWDILRAWREEFGWMSLARFAFLAWDALTRLVWPFLLGMLVNALHEPEGTLGVTLSLFVAYYAVQSVVGIVREYVDRRVSLLRAVFHDELLIRLTRRIPLDRFEDARLHQRLERVSAQIGNIADTPYRIASVVFRGIVVLGMLVALARMSLFLLGFALGMTLVITLPRVWSRQAEMSIWMDTSDNRVKYGILRSKLRSTSLDTGVDRRVFGYEDWLARKMRSVIDAYVRSVSQVHGAYAKIRLVLVGVQSLFLLGGVLTAFFLARAGRLTVGSMVSAVQLLISLPESLSKALTDASNTRLYAHLVAEYARVQRFFEEEKEERLVRVDPPFTIRFENVWFKYPGMKRWVLRGVSFTLHPGEKVALVGRNGVGKTTLIKLLLGIYTPQKGRILINDVPLERVDEEAYYARLAVLLQHAPRPAFPVRDALHTARLEEDFDVGKAARVLRRVGLRKLVGEWDVWLHKHVEHGRGLSGGEWQLLLIARVLYRDPALVILDEPTSSVDALHEERVFRLIMRATRATVLMVTHRLTSVRHAERILVLDKGRIVEEGSHDALMREGGLYARMYTAQVGSLEGKS